MPRPETWRDVVALASGRDPKLHADLLHYVHPVRVAAPHLEIRPQPGTPRDLPKRLAGFLHAITGARWTVGLADEGGAPTLAEQGRAAEHDRRERAEEHPLVRAVLEAFPGARIEAVRDAALDAYGLRPLAANDSVDGRDFAPPEAEPVGFDDDITEED
jgi:DNA polymerase-3 subunit gamma/tau